MVNILVAEDDDTLRHIICTVLSKNGYVAFPAIDGEDALRVLEREHIDLFISDIMMPKVDGYDLTRALRDSGYTLPILMVTARESFEDKKRGFLAGADDYMVKPIEINEMLLRVGALLRRAKIANEHRLICGSSVLDYDSLTVTVDGVITPLPQKEFLLLFKLLSYPGKIFTRSQLMDEIWGVDSETDERTVDVHVNRLRDHFRDCPDFSLVTIRGLGYKAVRANA
ncbi:MAG: response regulator transcription factor [Oscillospiraceae bacterium]